MSSSFFVVAASVFAFGAVTTVLRLRRGRAEDSLRRGKCDFIEATQDDALFARAARAAVSVARNLTQAQRADLYRLYKQATEGPCDSPPPPMTDWVARAKHDAWRSLGSMTKQEAAARYVTIVDNIGPSDWRVTDLDAPPEDAEDADPSAENHGAPRQDDAVGFISVSRPVSDAPLSKEEIRGDIFAACLAGDGESVAHLLDTDSGWSVTSRNGALETPLHAAADAGHLEVVLLLLSRGADCNALEEGGMTPLDYALTMDHKSVAAALQFHAANRV